MHGLRAWVAIAGGVCGVLSADRAGAAGPEPVGPFEVRPYVGGALWPHSLTAWYLGADVAYRPDPLWGLQLDGALYAPLNAGEGASPSWPLNESQLSTDLDLVVFPLSKAAGTFEPWVLGGLGVVRTRPVSVVDPADRSFVTWNTFIDLDVGAGVRAFVNRWFAIDLEARDLVYYERRENPVIVSCPSCAPGSFNLSPQNPSTWYSPNTYLTNVLQVRVGASFFLGL